MCLQHIAKHHKGIQNVQMEQIRYLDSKQFKEFLRKESLRNNKSINKLIQDALRAYFNKAKTL